MKTTLRVVCMACCLGSLLPAMARGAETAAGPPAAKAGEPGVQATAAKTSFEVTNDYTAQRRPRAAVFVFDNSNQGAQATLYGSSVEAMLVTFLKRKSQFVVLERKDLNLKNILAEKSRMQGGVVAPDDIASEALLEKSDVLVLGSVTILDHAPPLPQKGADEKDDDKIAGEDSGQSESDQERVRRLDSIPGPRIEIDLKLISRFDGRIIAAAQRSGPVACLRSIVERLGIALEQEFLRPYYGKLTVNLTEPEHIRVFLTPILPEDALDEEKPPVEHSSTVTIGRLYDTVEAWTTDPTTYTITNVLSGWYSMRIERPGYDPIGLENSRWEVRKRQGKEVVYDRVANVPIEKVDPQDRRFVVRVDPLTTEIVDGNALGFKFNKQGGSLALRVKRQYLDTDFSQAPRRVVLMGDAKVELNQLQRPAEYADNERCDLFKENDPPALNYGRTYIAPGQSFDFSSFKGGQLIIEDYKGEVVPVGAYKMVLWEPSYQTEETEVRVRAGDDKKQVKTSLIRETAGLSLTSTGPRTDNKVLLEGRETRVRYELSLNFEKPLEVHALPVDTYVTTTDVAGLDGWQRSAVVPASNLLAPKFNINSPRHELKLIEAPRPKTEVMARAGVKTRFGLAGRLETLSRRPDPVAADLFIDDLFPALLNLLLYGAPNRFDARGNFLTASGEAGQHSPTGIGAGVSVNGESSEEPERGGVRRLFRSEVTVDLPAPDSSEEPMQEAPGGPYILVEITPLPPEELLKNPVFLRTLLAERLEYLDLVVLDQEDMARLRRSPEVAGIFSRYVASGGALFAYVADAGDYRQVIGAPLAIEKLSKRTRRLDLAPGEVDGLIPKLSRKEVKVKSSRALPEVADLSTPWRILAYTRKGRRPRIVDRGGQVEGGYAALWLDNPQAFRSRWGGTRPKVEETRGRVEDHVIQQARTLMHRRFDRSNQAMQPCTPPAPAAQ